MTNMAHVSWYTAWHGCGGAAIVRIGVGSDGMRPRVLTVGRGVVVASRLILAVGQSLRPTLHSLITAA